MKANILIVDDARLNREIFKLALLQDGYRFYEAADGKQAVEMVERHQIDLILLDLMMPVMDGFQFLEWRQSKPAFMAIPVIVHSALDDFQSLKKALTMGSYDYVTKPLPDQELKVILPLKVKNAVTYRQAFLTLSARNERLEKELELAGIYQRSLLPLDPRLAGVTVSTLYRPYIGVAGDFFDIIPVEGGVAVIIADVSGHGLLSAMVSSQLKLLFARYMNQTRSPGLTLSLLNKDLMGITRAEDFVTAFCALLDLENSTLRYATAGHPEQLYHSQDRGEVVRISGDGLFLGMFDESELFEQPEEMTLPTKPGDRLLVFTDGVVEALDPQRRPFGLERWEQAFRETLQDDPGLASARLEERLQDHTQGAFQDDVAFMVIDLGDPFGG